MRSYLVVVVGSKIQLFPIIIRGVTTLPLITNLHLVGRKGSMLLKHSAAGFIVDNIGHSHPPLDFSKTFTRGDLTNMKHTLDELLGSTATMVDCETRSGLNWLSIIGQPAGGLACRRRRLATLRLLSYYGREADGVKGHT